MQLLDVPWMRLSPALHKRRQIRYTVSACKSGRDRADMRWHLQCNRRPGAVRRLATWLARANRHSGAVALVFVLAQGALAHTALAKPRKVTIGLGLPAGTIVIVNRERKLYYVLDAGAAMTYPVAVGTRAELWTGHTFVSAKRENPWWFPVDGGPAHPGGKPDNPLGKRALYLDWTLLRIHGTPSRRSVGRAVSNGCIRMLNEDVIDLYERVHLGAPVIAVNRRKDLVRYRQNKRISGKKPVHPEARAGGDEMLAYGSPTLPVIRY